MKKVITLLLLSLGIFACGEEGNSLPPPTSCYGCDTQEEESNVQAYKKEILRLLDAQFLEDDGLIAFVIHKDLDSLVEGQCLADEAQEYQPCCADSNMIAYDGSILTWRSIIADAHEMDQSPQDVAESRRIVLHVGSLALIKKVIQARDFFLLQGKAPIGLTDYFTEHVDARYNAVLHRTEIIRPFVSNWCTDFPHETTKG